MSMVFDYFRDLRRESVEGWNRFWFTPADPATLGLIRLLAGAMIFYTHLVWGKDLLGFFGPDARISNDFAQTMNNSSFAWSWLFWMDSPALLWATHVAVLIILAMYMLGLFSRVTSVLAFLITVAYANRATGALFGLDQVNGLLAMYVMLGPCGAAFSIDSLLRRKGWMRQSGSSTPLGAESDEIPRYTSANIAIRLIQVHMCIMYLFAGTGKLMGDTWWSGTAMWGALANYEYQSIDVTWLAAHPLILNVLTQVTLVWECSYIFLVWPRLTRPIVIALAVPLHLGIALFMGMMTFGLAMLIGNLAFVSPKLVRTVFAWPVSATKMPAASGAGG